MGGLTSKQVDEVVKASKSPKGTPKRTRVLPFDPRSPSDNVNRTPITVSKPPSDSLNSTPINSTTSVWVTDPRSPSCEVERTPVIVESAQQRRHFPLKPSKLTQLENLDTNQDEALDPRSPSSKVPRTPLDGKRNEFTDESSPEDESEADSFESCEVKEEVSGSEENAECPKSCSDDTEDKARKPLQAVQNTRNNATDTPRGLLQAKHCRSVEEEFNKNQKILLRQLSNQDNSITSATQFVENI